MTNVNLPDYAEVPLAILRYDPENARKHGSVNLDVIKHSLLEFGQTKPILVTRDHVVVAGNGTLRVARSLKWKTIKVAYTDLPEEQWRAYALVDNQSALLASWDMPILAGQMADLSSKGWDLAALGFGVDAHPAPDEQGEKAKTDKSAEYLVVVQCRNEDEQQEVYENLKERGHACKLL